MKIDPGTSPDIGLEKQGRAAIITLRRTAALNALTHGMILAMQDALAAWEQDPEVAAVIIRGEGRAFCAGGDIGAIYRKCRAGEPPLDFFADEYRLNLHINRYSKPYIALLDGIVMGGGAGVSVHGSHRVVTEKARFAMPETGIGFIPDVGASHFLPRLPDRLGYWLGLTGQRIGWGECLRQNIATHAVPSEQLDALVEEICATGDADQALAARAAQPEPEMDEAELNRIAAIFAAPSLEEVTRQLGQSESPLAAKSLAALGRASPTSLQITWRLLREGAGLPLAECLAMEFRIVKRLLEGHDFMEGIRAAIIDKDGSPQWHPATLTEIDPAAIDACFASLGEEEWQAELRPAA